MKTKHIIWVFVLIFLIEIVNAYFETEADTFYLDNSTRHFNDDSNNYTISGYNYVYQKIATSYIPDDTKSFSDLNLINLINILADNVFVSLQCGGSYDGITNITLFTTHYHVEITSDNKTIIKKTVDRKVFTNMNDIKYPNNWVKSYDMDRYDYLVSELIIGYNGTRLNASSINLAPPVQFCSYSGGLIPSFSHGYNKFSLSDDVINNIQKTMERIHWKYRVHNLSYTIYKWIDTVIDMVVELWFIAYWVFKILVITFVIGLIIFIFFILYKLIKDLVES